MKIKGFSRNDTDVIKGVAILCIILHNLFHCINPSTGENEFIFSSSHILNLINGIIANPLEIVNLMFSYFGHYGVQLFIFISGYGLAISMSKKDLKWMSFIIERLKKLYPLLIVGLLFYILGKILIFENFLSIFELKHFALKFAFLHTIYPEAALKIIGPWWFFGLILQLYMFFPLLFKVINKYNEKALIIILLISYSVLYVAHIFFNGLLDNVLMSCFGHFPEFSLGIWFSFNKNKKISNYIIFAAFIIFVLGNFYSILFPLTFLSISIILIWAFNIVLSENRKNILTKALAYYGSISMAIFAIHSIYRVPFVNIANSYNSPLITLLLALLFLMLITILSMPAKSMYICMVSKLSKNKIIPQK